MQHQQWLKMRQALLQAEPQAGRATLQRLPCTTLQAWLAHHAWHTAQEHFHGKALAAQGEEDAHQAWAVEQQETAHVYEAVAEEFWQVRAACTCVAHRVAQDYRLVYTALTGAALPEEPTADR
jgi:hypothetical protein